MARLEPPLAEPLGGLDPDWPLKGGLACDWLLPLKGVQELPNEDAPEVEDMGDDDPSWMGGESAEAA